MIKIDRIAVAIERAITVAPYTVHKVRIEVQADVPKEIGYAETLEALREVVSADVETAIERESLEYGGND